MSLYSIKHSKLAYRIDFALYAALVLIMVAILLLTGTYERWLAYVALAAAGVVSWTLIEYALHRFVMHGFRPFKQWHTEHHQRPKALIYTPTIMSMALIATLVFLPAQTFFRDWQSACALTLGVVIGYLFYSVVHHLMHHNGDNNIWLKRRKQWHAMHHQNIEKVAYFGVTSGFWDHVFRSDYRLRKSTRTARREIDPKSR